MGSGTLIIVSILSAVEIIVILASVDTHALKVFLGYKVFIDVFYGVGMTIYMGLSGTISGVVIATFAGFFMTVTLAVAASMIGYRRCKTLADGTKVWVDYAPTLTVSSVKKMMTDKVVAVKSYASKFNKASVA